MSCSTTCARRWRTPTARGLPHPGEQTGVEGCLSVKGKYGTVTRAEKITVTACDRYGKKKKYKVEGFTARAFQHEMDHLDGVLYTSKCKDLKNE